MKSRRSRSMTHDVLRRRLLERASLTDPPPPKMSLERMYETQWSDEFIGYMRNRLVVGCMRYGDIRKGEKKDNVRRAIQCLQYYVETGNQEALVDAANFCVVEFLNPGSHSHPFFEGTDRG
jgi:hypothetical protein